MNILRAVGLIIAIIGLKLLVSEVFWGLEQTLLQFFDLLQASAITAQNLISGYKGF